MSTPSPTTGVHRPAITIADSGPSLTTVLTRLDHACTGRSSTTTSGLDPVWFAWRATSRRPALVVLDVAEGSNTLAMRRLLHDVNACTSTDQIRVLARRVGDRGRALAALTTATLNPTTTAPSHALVLA